MNGVINDTSAHTLQIHNKHYVRTMYQSGDWDDYFIRGYKDTLSNTLTE